MMFLQIEEILLVRSQAHAPNPHVHKSTIVFPTIPRQGRHGVSCGTNSLGAPPQMDWSDYSMACSEGPNGQPLHARDGDFGLNDHLDVAPTHTVVHEDDEMHASSGRASVPNPHHSVSEVGSSGSEVDMPPIPVELFNLVSKYVDWSDVDNVDMSMQIQRDIAEFWETWWIEH